MTLFGSLAGHKWIAILIVVLTVWVGSLLNNSLATQYEATAGVIVQDPRAPATFSVISSGTPSNISSERSLADQVQIIESQAVAELASQSLGGDPNAETIRKKSTVEGSATSNLIQVHYIAGTPEAARDGADALVNAYLDVRSRQVEGNAKLALARVDALEQGLDAELTALQEKADQLISDDPALQELNDQMDEALVTLNDLRNSRDAAQPGSTERNSLNDQIDELNRDFEVWERALRLERQDSDVAQILAEQEATIAELASLSALRNSITVEAEVKASGVTLVSAAQLPTEPARVSMGLFLVGLLILGLALAAIVSYSLTLRKNRREIQAVERNAFTTSPLERPPED